MRTVILDAYVKRKYPEVDYRRTIKVEKKVTFLDTFLHEIGKTIGLSIPIVALSITASLSVVSVFSVYILIFQGLQTVVSTFTSGTTASFGNLIAEKEDGRLKKTGTEFFVLINLVLLILYITATVVTIDFLKVYLKEIDDIGNYIVYYYPLLFALWMYLENIRLPQQTILQAAGKYKEMRVTNLIQIGLQVLLTFIFSYFWGITGALIGTSIGSVFKLIAFTYLVNKELIKGYFFLLIKNVLIGIVLVLCAYFVRIQISNFLINDLFSFVVISTIVVITLSLFLLILNIMVNHSAVKGLFIRVKNIVKK